jgi:hypothetical protein
MPQHQKPALSMELLSDQKGFAAIFVTGPWCVFCELNWVRAVAFTLALCEKCARYMVRDPNPVIESVKVAR